MLADGVVVGRIFKSAKSPLDAPWIWALLYGFHEDHAPTHGYKATREAADSFEIASAIPTPTKLASRPARLETGGDDDFRQLIFRAALMLRPPR